MKKIIAILMCAALLFSLAACSGGNGSEDIETVPDVNIEADADTTEATTEEPEVSISRGKIDGDVYDNDFAGFTFTKPAEWRFLSDKEISETINVGQDILDLNALEKTLSEKASVYDMSAQDENGNSVMLCYENTMMTALREITLDEYEQIMKSNLDLVEEINYEFQSSEDVKLGETSYRKLLFTAEVDGYEMYQAYYSRIIGKYVITVILTSTTEEIATMEKMFS